MDEITKIANAATKALAWTENGGKPDIENPKAGKTGEAKSIFQFTPATWKVQAKKYLKNENAPINADNETFVANSRIKDWLKQGNTVSQIASMWNAGSGEPNAYTGKFSDGSSSVGINKKYGVKYDVPSYAKSVADYAKKFYKEEVAKDPNQMTMSQSDSNFHNEALDSIMKMVKESPANVKAPQNSLSMPQNGLVQLPNSSNNTQGNK